MTDTLTYGPHCHHDECSWFRCDHTGLVDFPCQHQDSCDQWPRLAQRMEEWLTRYFGTIDPELLRWIDKIPDSAIRYAHLLKAHP